MTARRKLLILGIPAAVGFAALVRFLLQPDPQRIVHRAQNALLKAKTLRYEVEVEFRGIPGSKDAPPVEISAATRTDADVSEPLRPASVTTFSIRSTAAGGVSELAGENRKKDRAHYLKLSKATGVYEDDAGPIVGVWARSAEPFLGRLVPLESKDDERPLDGEGVRTFLETVSLAPVARVTDTLKEERSGGAVMRHYKVALYADVAAALLIKLRELKTGAAATTGDVAAAAAEVASWGRPTGEVWIGKKDGRIRKLTVVTPVVSAAGAGDLTATILFSRYGEPVRVEAPAARDLDELIGTTSEKHLGLAGSRQAAAETAAGTEAQEVIASAPAKKRDADSDGLEDTQEFFYGADLWNPDTDGDGWTDGYEVGHGTNPVGPGPLFGFGL